jgi:uncharacterized protein (DUF58 family)
VSPPAVAWATAGLVVAAVGGAGSPALLAAGIGLLLLMGAAWAVLDHSARRMRVDRRVAAVEVREDAPVRLRFEMDAPRWLPVRVEIEDHVGGWRSLKRRGSTVELRICRPGSFVLAPSRLRLRDPVGIFERQVVAGRRQHVLVLPAPVSERPRGRARLAHLDDAEPQGLAPYVPGVPVSRIHWPTLARGGDLQVRHLAPPPDRLPLVIADPAGASRPEALDWVARTAAGQILTLARQGGCRVWLPGEGVPVGVVGAGGAWRAVHRRLAMLDRPGRSGQPPASSQAAEICIRAADAPVALAQAPRLPDGVRPAA